MVHLGRGTGALEAAAHAPGWRAGDGASAFRRVDYPQLKAKTPGEIDFAHYHTYDETVGLLRSWATKYPDLVDLYSVGQSLEGR